LQVTQSSLIKDLLNTTTHENIEKLQCILLKNKNMTNNKMQIINKIIHIIKDTKVLDPHPGLIIASHNFSKPYPLINEIDKLSLATMDLLNISAYPSFSGYCTFTISLTLEKSNGEEISLTLGHAIPLTYQDNCQICPRHY